MDTLIIGCRTLENELNSAMTECDCPYDVRWLDSGLHIIPKKLNAELQSILDTSGGYLRALLAFGFCGNALAGLQSRDMFLIVPRVDDCISLLLGSQKNRAALVEGNGTYFLTEGWLKGEHSIGKEYTHIMEKYGEETGQHIFEGMFGNYKTLAMLDTGCFDLPRAEAEAMDLAKALRLEYKVIPATVGYLKKLL
ncbi:MAG: DUF1638 domain-containing protein, partial [Peptococcaceae bacterium]|nr:DUF1638 domain-containing protein [Peptococcaceae bacterium]